MTRRRVGSLLTALAAVLFAATAAMHHTGYGIVTRLAEQGPVELQQVVPMLWLAVSVDLVVLALIIAVVAWRQTTGGRLIVCFAAITPFADAALQIRFIGFILPTAILLTVGAVTLAAAALQPPVSREAAPAS
jgi:hypothetical protein